MIIASSRIWLCPIYGSRVLSREWRCSWSNAARRCSNYIWVINNLFAYKGAPYIRDLTVRLLLSNLSWDTHVYILVLQMSYINELLFLFYIREASHTIHSLKYHQNEKFWILRKSFIHYYFIISPKPLKIKTFAYLNCFVPKMLKKMSS